MSKRPPNGETRDITLFTRAAKALKTGDELWCSRCTFNVDDANQALGRITMKLNSRMIATASLMFALAGVSFAQQVKTDYDRSANFGQYKTYSWQNVSTSDPLMVDRIKSAVNSALAAKGWTEVPS